MSNPLHSLLLYYLPLRPPCGLQQTACGSPGELEQFWTAAQHPRNPQLALVAAGPGVQLWDVQAMRQAGGVEVAHRMRTWDVSWAPGNEHRFVTGGDDCKLRFWDTRWGAGVGCGGVGARTLPYTRACYLGEAAQCLRALCTFKWP
jgi:hypothetical protein